jgi:YkoY family integral membrane protein
MDGWIGIPTLALPGGVMEAESIESLTPLIRQADQWRELLVLLPLLVALEAVLSADNAIALAAISRRLHDRARQETALNLGLLLALVFRLGLIITAEWVLNFWPLQLAASLYLLWLCGRHLQEVWLERLDEAASDPADAQPGPDAAPQVAGSHADGHHGLQVGLGSVVATLALTDLAFSIDSVAAAVAVSDRLLPVMAGGVIGVIALRLTAELFIRWLEIFEHLETAGYLAVGLVGVRLLLRLLLPQFDPPEWSLLLVVAGLFVWGFSVRAPQAPLGSD